MKVPAKLNLITLRKSANQLVYISSILQDIFYAQLDMSTGNQSIVSLLYNLLSNFIKPPLSNYKEWGDLMKTDAGKVYKKEFLGDFESFLSFLDSK